MTMRRFLMTLLAGLLWSAPAMAQIPDNCTISDRSPPDHQVLECPGGLVVDIAAATQLGLIADDQGSVARITLQRGAIFVQVDPDGTKPVIETPHAIAAVRGTTYMVGAADDHSAVFVEEGTVDVGWIDADTFDFVLTPGEGVDMYPGTDVEIKTWGAERIANMKALFGR